ncbi:MAG: TauD/TfdA family dioxygenase [Alphaproteobacteria bacterium]|nr:TauD/TfdA family dioxygenase [Alphaproteobacteria bacterium]
MLTPEELGTLPPVRQAMVRTHPASGEKALYVGSHAMAVEGVAAAEGRALIEELVAFATQPRFVHSHRWRPNDLVIWDNRVMLHRGRPYPYGLQRRTMVRTTVAGDGPTVAEPFAVPRVG